jgi:hypothetical protein
MAITAQLVASGHNRLRYLLSTTSTGTDTGTITTTGAATPDLLTDLGVNQGALMPIVKVIAQGYGTVASGAQTQAKARALFLSDRSGADPGGAGAGLIPTAICRLSSPNSGVGWLVDANVSGGNPTINLTSIGVGPAGLCFLDVYVPETIGK